MCLFLDNIKKVICLTTKSIWKRSSTSTNTTKIPIAMRRTMGENSTEAHPKIKITISSNSTTYLKRFTKTTSPS